MKKNKKVKTKRVDKQSPDLRKEILDQFKKLYPPLFNNEGYLNEEELEQLTKDFSTPQTEKYEFTWAGKQQSKKKAFTSSKATLRFDDKRSIKPDTTENLIIEGDNLETLKLLQKSYFGKIKCIYIDPPYNTGNDFIYSDNYSEDRQAYWEKAGVKQKGVKLDTNTDSSGRYHSNWLSMMYPRLLLARNLLREDGVIFVSIDDNEVHNLRKAMDEIFGEENFIAQLVWKSRQNKDNRNITKVSIDHEYIMCYGLQLRGDVRNTSQYTNPDKDPRGDWTSSNMVGLLPESQRPNCHYDLINPDTGINYGKPEMGWRYDQNTMNKLIEDNRILWPSRTDGRPRRKVFLNELQDKYTGFSSIVGEDVYTRNGTEELTNLFDNKKFLEFPKPTALLKEIIIQADNNDRSDYIILDFFAGSGSTADAVMRLNKEDNGSRKYILVQIPEATDKKSEAYRSGYKTISDICIERVKRSGKILKKNSKKLDTGFKVFKLSGSHFPENTFAPDPEKSDEENKKALEKYIKKASQQKLFKDGVADLVYEIALKDGFELTLSMEVVKEFGKNTVYLVKDNHKQAFICVDDNLKDETIKQIEKHKEERFICLHSSVNTTKKWNLQNALGSNLWLV